MSQVADRAETVSRSAFALRSLADSVSSLLATPTPVDLSSAIELGYFRPDVELALSTWFARFLTVRSALWEVLADVSRSVEGELPDGRLEPGGGEDLDHWRLFLVGYGAGCLIVQLDRHLVEEVATHTLVQRKLNEGSPENRIPRKQFTAVLGSLSDPSKALLLYQAMKLTREQGQSLQTLRRDADVGFVVERLEWFERALDASKRRFFRLVLDHSRHALRRRGASARQKTAFAFLESAGRITAEVRDHWTEKRVRRAIRAELAPSLCPGDVIVTRHDNALTNLFLPGYWPHVALYVGTPEQRDALSVTLDEDRRTRWSGDCCVLEALKDGARFRPLEETLAVDAFAVLRPQLSIESIARAIARASTHEGKGYNFDFDFFRSDRVVCTEVVYRGFDGVDGMVIPLSERVGRPTLSAEDLLDLGVNGDLYTVVAVYGTPESRDRIVWGEEAEDVIRRSYRA